MNLFRSAEIIYVSALAFLIGNLAFLRTYRIALHLYPLHSNFFQGISLTRSYLSTKYGLKIRLWSKSLIDHKVLFTGVYEASSNKILEKYIKPGSIVIEAGANIGTETLLLSRLAGNQGSIFAFEPVSALKDRLEENCRLNSLDNVIIEQLALGESNGSISFYIADEAFTNQGMGSKRLVNQHLKNEIIVSQVTLDTYCEQKGITTLHFIKMDIQGAELDLLKGGEKIITQSRPFIFLEAGDGWSSLADLYEWLSSSGFEVYLIREDATLDLIARENILPGNWLAKSNRF